MYAAEQIATFNALVDFSTTKTFGMLLPKGMRGRLKDMQVSGTVLFTAVTTQATLKLGVLGTLGAYGSLNLGTLAAGAAVSLAQSQPSGIVDTEIDKDLTLLITCNAPTGGSPAGTGVVTVAVLYY